MSKTISETLSDFSHVAKSVRAALEGGWLAARAVEDGKWYFEQNYSCQYSYPGTERVHGHDVGCAIGVCLSPEQAESLVARELQACSVTTILHPAEEEPGVAEPKMRILRKLQCAHDSWVSSIRDVQEFGLSSKPVEAFKADFIHQLEILEAYAAGEAEARAEMQQPAKETA